MCAAPPAHLNSRPVSIPTDWTDSSGLRPFSSMATNQPGQYTSQVDVPMSGSDWIHIRKDGWESVRPVIGHDDDGAQGSTDRKVYTIQRAHDEYKAKTDQACEPCRRRKSKCDGGAVCSRCINRGIQCVYGQPRKQPSGRRLSRMTLPSKTTAASGPVRGTTENSSKPTRPAKMARSSARTPVMTFQPLETTRDSPTITRPASIASPSLMQSTFSSLRSNSSATRPVFPPLRLELSQVPTVPTAPASAGLIPVCNHIRHPGEQPIRRNSMGNWVPSTSYDMRQLGTYVPTRYGHSHTYWAVPYSYDTNPHRLKSEPINQDLTLKSWRPNGPHRTQSSPSVNPPMSTSDVTSTSNLASTPSSLFLWSGEQMSEQNRSEYSTPSTHLSPLSSISTEAMSGETLATQSSTSYHHPAGMWDAPHYNYHQTSFHPIGHSYVHSNPYVECNHMTFDLIQERVTVQLDDREPCGTNFEGTLGLGFGNNLVSALTEAPMSTVTPALELPTELKEGQPGMLFWGDP